jgi:hypothetical protein
MPRACLTKLPGSLKGRQERDPEVGRAGQKLPSAALRRRPFLGPSARLGAAASLEAENDN